MQFFNDRKCSLIRAFNHKLLVDSETNKVSIGEKEIPQEIYVGGVESLNSIVLKKYSITHVLHADNRELNKKIEGYEVKKKIRLMNFVDCANTNFIARLPVCFEFLDEALKEEESRVLVHCFSGRSRSVAITCAYLMRMKKLGYKKVLEAMKIDRRIVKPNNGFMDQLKLFEWNNCLLDEKVISMSKILLSKDHDYLGSRYQLDNSDFEEIEKLCTNEKTKK